MRKLFSMAMAVMAVCVSAAVQDTAKDKTAAAKPASEKSVKVLNPPKKPYNSKKTRRKAQIREEGGLVLAPATGRVVRVVNAQARIPEIMFREVVMSVNDQTRLPFEITRPAAEGKTPTEYVKEAFALEQTGVVIAVVDDADTPTLLLAPENGWIILNVRKLAADNPLEGVLKARLTKEMWRAAAMVLGCYQSIQKECVTRVITSVKDLDAEPWLVASPEPFNKMHMTAERLGIQMHRVCTYKRACEEGWAAPPKTEIQKQVWERMRADKERGPTNALQIPSPKKDK